MSDLDRSKSINSKPLKMFTVHKSNSNELDITYVHFESGIGFSLKGSGIDFWQFVNSP